MEISVSAGAFISLAMAILILPFKWLLAWVLAAFVHELFHYIALRLCGISVYETRITAVGASMIVCIHSGWKAVICALAGPFGGLVLLLLLRWMPRTALCGLFQTMFNLIPIYPFDGGRALKALLTGLFPQNPRLANKVETAIIILFLLFIAFISVKYRLGVWGGVLFGSLFAHRRREKTLQTWRRKVTME